MKNIVFFLLLQLTLSFPIFAQTDANKNGSVSLEQLNYMAEIIAAIAVVVSLLCLEKQIKRSRIQSEYQAMDAIVNRRADFLRIVTEDHKLSLVVAKGFSSRTRLTPNEYYRFGSYLYTTFMP